MQNEQQRVKSLANTLDAIVRAYEHADNVGAGKELPVGVINPFILIPGFPYPGPVIPNPLWPILFPWLVLPWLRPNKPGKPWSWETDYYADPEDPFTIVEGSWDYSKHGKTPDGQKRKGKGTIADRYSDFIKNHSTEDKYQSYYDPKTGKWTDIDQNNEDQKNKTKELFEHSLPVDVTLFGVGTGASWSSIHGEGEVKGKYGGASGSVDVNKIDANLGVNITQGNVNAKAGISYTAFTASGKAYLGGEDLNVHAEGEVVAGKVGAEAEASIGWMDSKGNFNPNAHAGVKAEAIAGEISGKVGVDTPIGDVNVKGSLNYGIGAHADIGVKDGKITLDIGATVGVGGSIKLEVDVSKPIKAVGKFVKSLKFW
ncbi:MAG: hypothetical protein K6G61_08425 [Solobacterium sp.]|nr:hypothetical protein [Solobacterium sp.]